ncbi:hypothetical protein D3C84_718290 [compost metagenome]
MHHAIGAGHLDEFTGLDGAEDDQQETGGEVGERTLQRQTDGQTGSTDNGNEGGGLHSDPAQGGDHYEHQDGVLEDAADEVGDCGIQLAGLHHLDHGTADEVGGDVTDQQGEQGGGDVDRVLDDQPLVVDQPGLRFGNDLGFHRMSCWYKGLWRMNLTPERDNLGRIWCFFCVIASCHKKQGRPRPPFVLEPVWLSFAAAGCA